MNGYLKNHIIGKGNFSDAMANHYISILLYNDLLLVSKDENSRICYHTTEKGKQMIRNYNTIQLFFSQVNNVRRERPDHRLEIAKIRNILIVEDDLDIGSALKAGLEEYGSTVELHNDPLTMLSAYKPRQFNLLVFDIHMPKLNGFDLYRLIESLTNVPMFVSSLHMKNIMTSSRKTFPSMDMKYFIRKPIPMKDLINRVNRLGTRIRLKKDFYLIGKNSIVLLSIIFISAISLSLISYQYSNSVSQEILDIARQDTDFKCKSTSQECHPVT